MSSISTPEEVESFVLTACAPLPPVRLAIAQAAGLVLAEGVSADGPVPPFANSAMDGFALRSLDTSRAPVRLTITAELMAGQTPDRRLSAGEAIRIMTGAPMPEGADAVCPVENVGIEGLSVLIREPIPAGKNVRRAGEDIARGSTVFPPGTVLSPAHVGVLASLGIRTVTAVPRPRVGVLSTGDELVAPPRALGPGQIRDANRPALLATLQHSHFETVDLGIVSDDRETVAAALKEGLGSCDALVSSGGVSAGDRDTVREAIKVLANTNAARCFQVGIRPARPFTFGILGCGQPVFGLPGNPVSALVAYELFCRPALLRLAGMVEVNRPRHVAVADEQFSRRRDGKVHFVRVIASLDESGVLHARSSGGQNPHLLYSMAQANALAVLPDGEGLNVGERVRLILTAPGRVRMAS